MVLMVLDFVSQTNLWESVFVIMLELYMDWKKLINYYFNILIWFYLFSILIYYLIWICVMYSYISKK
jgi:hypothetical protein